MQKQEESGKKSKYSEFLAFFSRLLSEDCQIFGRVPGVGGQQFCPHSRPIGLFSGWETENDELRLNISPAFDKGVSSHDAGRCSILFLIVRNHPLSRETTLKTVKYVPAVVCQI